MSIAFESIPSNLRVPGVYVENDFSRAGSPSYEVNPALLIGQATTISLPAVADTPIAVKGVEDAINKFGQGSHLHRMVAAYRANDRFGELWALPLADNGTSDATGTIEATSAATGDGTIALYIAGQLVRVGIEDGDAVGDIATAIQDAIGTTDAAAGDLPVTASAALGVVTLTARNAGTLGNDIDIRVGWAGESLPDGVALTITAMSGGSNDPTLDTGIANLGDAAYDQIAHPYTDSTPLGKIEAEMLRRWDWDVQVYGHAFTMEPDTQANLTTLGTARNSGHSSIFGYNDSPTPPWEWAAAIAGTVAKANRAGIGAVARPYQTLPLAGVKRSEDKSQRFTITERNTLLHDGIATVTDDTSTVRIEFAITTYQQNAAGATDDALLRVNSLYQFATFNRQMRNALKTRYPRHALADNNNAIAPGQKVLTPNRAKATILGEYRRLQSLGLVENIEAFAENLVVERPSGNPDRLDMLLPPDMVNQFRVGAILNQPRLEYQ